MALLKSRLAVVFALLAVVGILTYFSFTPTLSSINPYPEPPSLASIPAYESQVARPPTPPILPEFQGAAAPSADIVCKFANEADFHSEWFKRYISVLDKRGAAFHRKQWELAYIAYIVEQLGLCRLGTQGMVWAVGKERLVSFFANKGCQILASDMNAVGALEKGWATTNQHAASKEGIFFDDLVGKKEFDQRVHYRVQDMNFIAVDIYNTFDFIWSTCSMEHVGSIILGQRFVMDAMNVLKPGGIAIHTVEFTLSSLQETLEDGDTVLWRKQDVERLVKDLVVLGYEVFPIHWGAGSGVLDQTPDLPPYKSHDHIKLAFAGHTLTSFAIIVRKPMSWTNGLSPHQNGRFHDPLPLSKIVAAG